MPLNRLITTTAIYFCLCTLTIILFFHFPLYNPHLPNSPFTPANATLGFGTILAVSHARSPRRQSLLWGANLTDLDIVIPQQREWTDGDVHAFRAKQGSVISKGSALAWLGHLDALRWFLSTQHATALIIEDDTDWDITLRHAQIPLLAAAVRRLLSNGSTDSSAYWSPTTAWDLLYPGHCDDLLAPSIYLNTPRLLYADTSTPQHTALHPDTANFLRSLNVPSGTRLLHSAHWPFCTFAYAVTRRSAQTILETLSHEKEGGTSAFDVALLESCRDSGWRCYSVSPELFHHTQGESEIWQANVNATRVGRDRGTRGTWNIACAARHPQLWVDVEDGGMRAEVKRRVRGMVARGECAVDALEEESGWRGCEWGECGSQS